MSTETHLTETDLNYLRGAMDAETAAMVADLLYDFPDATVHAHKASGLDQSPCLHVNYGSDYDGAEILERAVELGLRGGYDAWPCVYWPKITVTQEFLNTEFPDSIERDDEDEDCDY